MHTVHLFTLSAHIECPPPHNMKVLHVSPGRICTHLFNYAYNELCIHIQFSGGSRKNERGFQTNERAARNFWGYAHFRSHVTRENPILSQGKSHNILA